MNKIENVNDTILNFKTKFVLIRGLVAGAIGGMFMGLFMMAYTFFAGMGFFTPLNIGISSIFYTVSPPQSMIPMLTKEMGHNATPQMMSQIMTIKAGHPTNSVVASLMKEMPSNLRNQVMNTMPVSFSRVFVGLMAHMAFSMMIGLSIGLLLLVFRRRLNNFAANSVTLMAITILISLMVFFINEYLIMKHVAPMITVMPIIPFLIAHIIFGAVVGGVLIFGKSKNVLTILRTN
jgi:hypothetical protein